MNGIRKRFGTGVAAVILAVGIGVVGAASPASAASWKYVTYGPYSGVIACTGNQMNLTQNGYVVAEGCYRVGSKFFFMTRYWA